MKERRIQFAASLMYKITHDLAPKQLIDIFQKTPSSQHYNLRGSTAKLYLPKLETEYLKKSLIVIAEQNCGIASQTNFEINNPLVNLTQVCDTLPVR